VEEVVQGGGRLGKKEHGLHAAASQRADTADIVDVEDKGGAFGRRAPD
jgi:hypothetical protein